MMTAAILLLKSEGGRSSRWCHKETLQPHRIRGHEQPVIKVTRMSGEEMVLFIVVFLIDVQE